MPNKWPLANGNWSSAANWNGGTLPVNGDTIYLNGRTVTLDVDISLPTATIRNDASVPDGVIGGGTVTMSANRTLTVLEARAFSSNSGNTPVIGMSANCHFIGNIAGGTATGNPGIYPVGSAGTRMITGNIIGGSAGNSGTNTASGIGTANFGGAIFIVNGNVTGGSVSGACGIRFANNGDIVTVNGNVIGGSNSGCPGIGIDGTTCTIAVNGNVQGDTGRGIDWISTGSSATIAVSGNSIGGSNIGIAIPSGATGSLTVTGNAIAGTATGVVNSAVGFTCTINGIAIASTTAHGVSSSGPCVIGSSTTSSNGRPGSSGITTFASSGPTTLGVVNQTNGSITMVQSTALGDYPATGNVRSGTAYNYGTLTGTCAVPSANQVAVGVSVDNTVGTAVISADSIRDALGLASANLDTQLSGLASDIDNITVDNVAIAGAVRSELTPELDLISDIDEKSLDIQSRIPATLDGGNMRSSVQFMAANTLTASALAADAVAEIAAAASVNVAPLQATAPNRVAGTQVVTYINDISDIGPIAVSDSNGDAVDLSAYTLKVCVEQRDGTVLHNATPTVSGTGNNQITWTPNAASVATTDYKRWSLRVVSTGQVLALGDFIIDPAAKIST